MIKGKAITFGDDVDTDQIIGAQHLSRPTVADMAPFAFEHHTRFMAHFTSGDILVGGENFGCGSSREQAPAVLAARGVAAVIACSFARIFFRNAINQGLPVLVCPEAGTITDLDCLEVVDLRLYNLTTGIQLGLTPLPPFIQELVAAGGILAHLREKDLVACRLAP